MGRAVDLLIVDDDRGQLQLVEAMIRELGLQHRCHYTSNGFETLDFLHRVHPFEKAPRPQLILMDLNMPGMDGCEVLQQLKSDPALLSIPVIMFSSSQAEKDVSACYREHGNAYVRKPADFEETLTLFRDIDRFWAQSVTLAS
jgi:CheY-like chemotaxis protein